MKITLKKVMILGVLLVGMLLVGMEIKKQDAYLKVNESYIGGDEIAFVTSSIKSKVVSEIQGRYGIAYDEDFWNTDLGGTTASTLLEQEVMRCIVRNTITEALLEEAEILQYHSFEEFNNLFRQVNVEREQAVAKGEVIYGPVVYSQFDYYNYMMANNLIALRDYYIQTNKIQVTDAQLKAYEASNPTLIHREPDDLDTTLLFMKFVEEDGTISLEKEQLYLEVMNRIYQELQAGSEVEEILLFYPEVLICEDYLFLPQSERKDQNLMGNLLDELEKLEEGEFTPVTRDNGAYYIGLLNKREMGNKRSFESYKDFLMIKYVEEWIQTYIDELIAEAQVIKLKDFYK